MPARTEAVGMRNAHRIAGFGLNSANAAHLAAFYVAAFGARQGASERLQDSPLQQALGVGGNALRHTLELGEQVIEIWQFDKPGRPYPRPLSPYGNAFQHFALVVNDMNRALSLLRCVSGWTPISQGGPQHLPQRSGGVSAFKFQDPEGHPLELLAFSRDATPEHWQARSSQGIVLGIDHSAISVRDTMASVQFYASLGFKVTGQTLNHGVEQAHLDGVADPEVEVTALSLDVSVPHLELLCYRREARLPPQALAGNDVAATRIALAVPGPDIAHRLPEIIVDPDGHRLFPS